MQQGSPKHSANREPTCRFSLSLQPDQHLEVRTHDGLRLETRFWRPATPPFASVLIVHGYAEHQGRYQHVVECFVKSGLSVVSFDLRGHGRSEGRRAFVTRFDHYVDDLMAVLAAAEVHFDGPTFLLGHSVGGLITVKACLQARPKIRGVVLSSAALKISDDFSPLLQRVAALVRYVAPNLKTTKIDDRLRSRDEQVGQDFRTDPLNYHGGIVAAYGYETLQAIKQLQTQFEQFDLPVSIWHGADDKLIDPQGSIDFHRRCRSTDKELHILSELRHEILQEPERDEILPEMVAWMRARA